MPWEGDWLETDHGGGWLEEKMCAALRGVQLHMQSGRDATAGLAALDGEAASSRALTTLTLYKEIQGEEALRLLSHC